MRPVHCLIFTDLDGTLLDHHTYSWAAAEDALAEIERRKVPLIFVTSKTRAEVEVYRRQLEHAHPFITENGGGIFVPQGYFNLRIEGAERVGHYHCLALARPYAEVSAALEQLTAESGASVVGFHQMTPREIAQNTGLSAAQAELAKRRDFDEPFFFAGAGEAETRRFVRLARQRGMEVSRGGRFWHLTAGSDKGRAVRQLIQLYRRALRHERFTTVGLGDSPNDLSMLARVDHAVLLPGPEGKINPALIARLPQAIRAPAPGPEGWGVAVLKLLSGFQPGPPAGKGIVKN